MKGRDMQKITIEIEGASTGQLHTLTADLALGMLPWKKYIKYKIKTAGKSYKLQALSFKHQSLKASSSKRQA
jgi:hypothetical protein|tara:strand:+ start:912 stop:1127 length:216 start_codon:yes stop_codon:yes gene_type:complete